MEEENDNNLEEETAENVVNNVRKEESRQNEPKGGAVTIQKSTLWKAGTAVFAILFLVAIFGGFDGFGSGGNAGTGTGAAVAPTQPTAPTANVKVEIEDNDPVLGDKKADISIVEFSDFQCPFCQRAHTGALAEFKNSDYFKKGEVNLIYKHFPLNSIHPQAQKAAEASECANRQGKFWEYHDTLFANQQALDVNSLKSYASQIGLNSGKFNTCLDSGEAASEVRKETTQATSSGGQGTPYFIVTNKKTDKTTTVSGAVPYAQFEAAINAVK